MMIVRNNSYGRLDYNIIILSGLQVRWSSDIAMVTEGNDVSISLLLDREPGVDLSISINTTDLNTTG